MDPFSLTVGILALIKATKAGYKLSKSTLAAPGELTALTDEIDAVENAVRNVQRIYQIREAGNHGTLAQPDQEALNSLTTLLVLVQERLQEVQTWIERKLRKRVDSLSGVEDATIKIKRHSIAKRLSKIQRLTKELERLRIAVHEATLLLNACTVQALSGDLKEVKALVTVLPQILGIAIEEGRRAIEADASTFLNRAVATICQEVQSTFIGESSGQIPRYETLRAVENQDYQGDSLVPSEGHSHPPSLRSMHVLISTEDDQSCRDDDANKLSSRSLRLRTTKRTLNRRIRINDLRQVAERLDAASSRMQTEFELSSSWFPETYSQKIRVPKFLCAKYQFLDHATGSQYSEWHVWWSASPRRWRMIRITMAASDERRIRNTPSLGRKDWKHLQYKWSHPAQLTLPCSVSHLAEYVACEDALAEDVTNLMVRTNHKTQVLELHLDGTKPYEPEDMMHRSTYRSAGYLMDAHSLGCRIILEREVVIKEIVSGFTARVLIDGRECVEKKLPLATFHLEPFLYELKALYMLRDCPGIIEFIGVEVDNAQKKLQGFIRGPEISNLSCILRDASKNHRTISWSTKEKWAGQLIYGLLSAHQRDLIVGTLDVNDIGVDEQQNANLLKISHGTCDQQSGCLAPELRFRVNHTEAERRLSAAHMTARQDIFALGLALWLIAEPRIPHVFITDARTEGRDSWWKRLFCHKAHCPRAASAAEAEICMDHTDPVDLPPCHTSVPMYFQHLIARCRASVPQQRATAHELMAIYEEHASAVP